MYHVELVQDVDNGLALGQLDGSIGAISDDLDTQEEVNWAHIAKLEVLLQFCLSPSNLDRVGASDSDVVNICRSNDMRTSFFIKKDKDTAV